MTAAELAEELGRTDGWLWDNWQRLCKASRLPHPLNAGERPLTWSRAQVYAWLDRDLSPTERLAAAAYRAAAAAAAGLRHVSAEATAIEDARAELDRRFR